MSNLKTLGYLRLREETKQKQEISDRFKMQKHLAKVGAMMFESKTLETISSEIVEALNFVLNHELASFVVADEKWNGTIDYFNFSVKINKTNKKLCEQLQFIVETMRKVRLFSRKHVSMSSPPEMHYETYLKDLINQKLESSQFEFCDADKYIGENEMLNIQIFTKISDPNTRQADLICIHNDNCDAEYHDDSCPFEKGKV